MKLVYISGPMSGLKNNNYPAFYKAEGILLEKGFKVINPAKLDEADDYVMKYSDYLKRDVNILFDDSPDMIVLIDGWENSKGVQVELAIMRALDKEVFLLEDGNLKKVHSS